MPSDPELQDAMNETVSWLSSKQALEMLRADPYWPKWDNPWWRMTLLWEMGHASLIPEVAVESMVKALQTHYLPDFPQLDEVKPPYDSRRHVICHCAVGTMFQVLHACGVRVDERLAWMRQWLFRYQLQDGGLNCDERVYVKEGGKSSMVSTLPSLEAILRCTPKPWTPETVRFLERGAQYLLSHSVVRRAGGDRGVIDSSWLEPTFPRFYFYDLLRGLSFLSEWSQVTGSELPREPIQETLDLLEQRYAREGGITIGRQAASIQAGTVKQEGGEWASRPEANSFALLEAVSRPGRRSPELSAEFERVRAWLHRGRASPR